MIAEIQCLPTPSGTDDDRYAHVHAAIEVIGRSGLAYEVGPLGTSIEGAIVVGDSIWDMLAAVRCRALGVGLLSGGYGPDELRQSGAFRVYEDPADLLFHIDEVGGRR